MGTLPEVPTLQWTSWIWKLEQSFPRVEELALAELPGTRKKKRRDGGRLNRREKQKDAKGATSKSLSGQLLLRAIAANQSQKQKQKKKDRQKKTPVKELSTVLAKILTKSKEDAKAPEGEQRRKKKKRRRLKDGTIISCSESYETSSYAESEDEESDADLEAPLKKKSRDCPGSVLNLLVAHVREQLDQGALTNLAGPKEEMMKGVKVMSYFNLSVKGSYPGHLRELRETHHLAVSIDLMRSGDVARAADAMSARFMALHQSLVDGTWATARHLELYPMEEASAAGAAAILATRRHAKLVAKVQGYPSGSWNNSGPRAGKGGRGKGDWGYGDSRGDQKGDGKAKGKGKKGKGKWAASNTQQRKDWGADKEKPEEKPKS